MTIAISSRFHTELHQVRLDHAMLSYECALIRRQLLTRQFNPNQPRDEAGRWAGNGGATVQPAFLGPAGVAVAKTIELGLALYGAYSALNSPDRQAAITFNARTFTSDGQGRLDVQSVARLDRDEVRQICDKFNDVQNRLDRITSAVEKEHPDFSAIRKGTEIHTRLAREIRSLDNDNYRAEVSVMKSKEARYYGEKGSLRYDAYELTKDRNVCVYDPKTGERGLSLPRITEMAARAVNAFGPVNKIIVMEMRAR
jgi:hypothetical protein